MKWQMRNLELRGDRPTAEDLGVSNRADLKIILNNDSSLLRELQARTGQRDIDRGPRSAGELAFLKVDLLEGGLFVHPGKIEQIDLPKHFDIGLGPAQQQILDCCFRSDFSDDLVDLGLAPD